MQEFQEFKYKLRFEDISILRLGSLSLKRFKRKEGKNCKILVDGQHSTKK